MATNKKRGSPGPNIKKDFNFKGVRSPIDRKKGAWKILLLAELGRTESGLTTRSLILNQFGFKSYSAMYYHEKEFLKNRLIKQVGKYPKTYILTDLGRSIIKKILGPSEGERPSEVWRFHHFIRGYKILDYGSFKFDKFEISPMTNWNYVSLKVPEGKEEVVVHVQDTGTVKIYCPTFYGSDHNLLRDKAVAFCDEVARKIAERFSMKISRAKDIRVPHFALVSSQKLAKLLINVKDPRYWVDFSLGTEELETLEPEHIQNVLDLPAILKDQLGPTLTAFSKQMRLHLEVMEGIKSHFVKQTAIFEEIKGLLRRDKDD